MLAHFLCGMPLSGDHGGGRKGKNRRRPKTTSQQESEIAVLDDIRLDKAFDESLLEMAMEKSLTEPHESHLLDMVIKMSLTVPAPQGSCNKKMACMIAQLGRFPKLLLGLHDPHNIRHAAGQVDVNE